MNRYAALMEDKQGNYIAAGSFRTRDAAGDYGDQLEERGLGTCVGTIEVMGKRPAETALRTGRDRD